MNLVWWKPAGSNDIFIIDQHEATMKIQKDMKVSYEVAEIVLKHSRHNAIVVKSGMYRHTKDWSYFLINTENNMEYLFEDPEKPLYNAKEHSFAFVSDRLLVALSGDCI